jgi:hypothetical protein
MLGVYFENHNESVGENDTDYNYHYWLHRTTTLIIIIQSTASHWQMIYLEKVIFRVLMIEL